VEEGRGSVETKPRGAEISARETERSAVGFRSWNVVVPDRGVLVEKTRYRKGEREIAVIILKSKQKKRICSVIACQRSKTCFLFLQATR
jgi:hypothetical protein